MLAFGRGGEGLNGLWAVVSRTKLREAGCEGGGIAADPRWLRLGSVG